MEKFTLISKLFSWFGAEFRVFSKPDTLIAFVKQKALVLKEEVTIFENEERTRPVYRIKARNVIDFHGTFDVFDAQTDRKIVSFQRRGFTSVIRDEWWVLDEDDRKIATVTEDSFQLALLRRFLSNLVPQTYLVTKDNNVIATVKQQFHFIRYAVDVSYDEKHFPYSHALALSVLLASIEGKQQQS